MFRSHRYARLAAHPADDVAVALEWEIDRAALQEKMRPVQERFEVHGKEIEMPSIFLEPKGVPTSPKRVASAPLAPNEPARVAPL